MTGGHEKRCTVTAVNLEYDVTKNWGKYNPHFDLFLTVECNVQTQKGEFPNTIEIKGKLKKELPVTDNKSWYTAFVVRAFFEACLNQKNLKLNDDYSIPDAWLDQVVGKEFMKCDYPTTKVLKSGKLWWDTYKIVAPVSSPQGFLKAKVLKDVQNGWIKNYANDAFMENHKNSGSGPPEPKQSTNEMKAALETQFDLTQI
jgi:hypothetical protein